MKRYKLGIALSGGGARGIAHIGVLQALEDHGFRPDVIAGTSAGAIAGALYAAGHTPVDMLPFVKQASLFKLFKVGLPYAGLTKHTYLRRRLEELIGEDSFEALKIPLYVAMSCLNTGTCKVRSSGPLYDAITASSAIPLIFQPTEIDGQLYVDGGLLENLPVASIREQTDFVIGVNVMPNSQVDKKAVQNVFGIAQRCFDLSILANTQPSLDRCDLVVEPTKVHNYTILQLSKYQQFYEIGYQAMAEQMDTLEERLLQKEDAASGT
jgi:NTE family protein